MSVIRNRSRRDFLRAAGALGSTKLLQIGAPAIAGITAAAAAANAAGASYKVLDSASARDFAAIAARIIPTTDTPGATEAGVIHFIDQAFSHEMSDALTFAEQELASFNASLDRRFASLEAAAQDRALRQIEQGDFFELLRTMTIFGFFAMSRYGGNQDNVAWKLIGFDGHHGAWQYPFGFYDANRRAGAADGEA